VYANDPRTPRWLLLQGLVQAPFEVDPLFFDFGENLEPGKPVERWVAFWREDGRSFRILGVASDSEAVRVRLRPFEEGPRRGYVVESTLTPAAAGPVEGRIEVRTDVEKHTRLGMPYFGAVGARLAAAGAPCELMGPGSEVTGPEAVSAP
jgi:hypothetical protein